MFRKKKRTIKFKVKPLDSKEEWPEMVSQTKPEYIGRELYAFCKNNEIECKRLKIRGTWSNRSSCIEIYGTEADRLKLYKYMWIKFKPCINMQAYNGEWFIED